MSIEVASEPQKVSESALPADLDFIPEVLKARAKTELFEDEDAKIKSLKLLRSMLKGEKELHWQDDDLFLLSFLRARKFDVERAFNLIKAFYKTLENHSDLYYNLSIDYMNKMMDTNTVYFLPYRDSEGCVVVAIQYTGWNPQDVSAGELVFLNSLGMIQALHSPATQIAGFKLVVDYKDINISQCICIRPSVLRFYADIIQKAFPVRMRGFHLINQNQFFSYMWQIMKFFFSKKLAKRIHLHGKDIKSLHKYFDPSILPAEFGGMLPPFDNTSWKERMQTSYDYLKYVCSFGYEKNLKDEHKSIVQKKNTEINLK